MLFNSFEFFVFLPIVFLLYWFVFNRSLRGQNILILVASYFFYGWWSYKFMGLLMLSTLLDYLYGFGVASSDKKRAKFFLWLSLINNLGILGVFKYYNFFALQFQHAFGVVGIHFDPMLLDIALPIGISFYTFHGMSYVFDIYRGQQKPIRDFVEYAVFVAFFPLLVAGPIERAHHLLPQVRKQRLFDYRQAVEGCRLILWGLIKKVVIADSLSGFVNTSFDGYAHLSSFSLILSAIAFSFQIYGDFSGYSDIALGTAKLFGFELLSNFKFPYFSRDIAEFWRRWHISLSSWFRDYLYIPLGGSRSGKMMAVRNTFIIFLVSGFWHGANWNYIAWGFIHACGFLPLLLLDRNRTHVNDVVAFDRALPTAGELWKLITTFTFVTFAWIFFRAHSVGIAAGYIGRIVVSAIHDPGQFLHIPEGAFIFLYIIPLLIGDWWLRRDERSLRTLPLAQPLRLAFYVLLMQLCLMKGVEHKIQNKSQTFIYFQF
ncbi:MAG: MBOAT family protein [Bacteroidetes bacterium]|nr:MBOAT family protein [Bacteroidota bacterium]